MCFDMYKDYVKSAYVSNFMSEIKKISDKAYFHGTRNDIKSYFVFFSKIMFYYGIAVILNVKWANILAPHSLCSYYRTSCRGKMTYVFIVITIQLTFLF